MSTEAIKTEFNSSLAKLMRIDKLRQELHIARFNNDMKQAFNCVVGLYDEIHQKLDEEERNEFVKLVELKTNVDHYYYQDKQIKTFKQFNDIYWSIDKYSRRLGELEFKYGLSIIDKPGAGTALMRGLSES